MEPWVFESQDGWLMRTPSYRLYTTIAKPQLREGLPMFLEACLANYTTALAPLPRPSGELETFILANRPQWARLTQRVMGEDAAIYLKIERGGFTANARSLLYDIGPLDTYAIAAHEGWHQYTQRTFQTPLPTSLEEGLATYMEGFRWDQTTRRPIFLPWANIERFDQLREAARAGKLMPLERVFYSSPQELIENDSDAALTYYAQVWAMIHFLRDGQQGALRDGLDRMLREAASGEMLGRIRKVNGLRAASAYAARRKGVDLLQLYTGHTAAELDGAYRDFIAKVVRVGAKQNIVRGKSPLE